MIPNIDTKTGCLPKGCHDTSINEFKKRFVDDFPSSKSRVSRFNGFVTHSKFICDNIKSTRKQMIDGSFTTNKIDPGDVDFLVIINYCDMTREEEFFIRKERVEQMKRKSLRDRMKKFVEEGFVDINELPPFDCFFMYKREPNDKLYGDYLEDREYWLNCFGHTRKDKRTGKRHPKGIINLTMNSETFKGEI